MFDGAFGDAGLEIVIEECLIGEEASFFALTDGEHILPLAGAQDHKAVGEGDKGPNTGGMGAYSPAPAFTEQLMAQTMADIIKPTVKAMKAKGIPYKGVLFAGLMLTQDGPKLIEYNCRFGDPECQVLMMRLQDDIVPLMLQVIDGTIHDHNPLSWHRETALTVVMAAKGYPGQYEKGQIIKNLDRAADKDGVEIFHAGTDTQNSETIAVGGRVLNVTGMGASVQNARDQAYSAIDDIDWPGGFCRRDIGWRALG